MDAENSVKNLSGFTWRSIKSNSNMTGILISIYKTKYIVFPISQKLPPAHQSNQAILQNKFHTRHASIKIVQGHPIRKKLIFHLKCLMKPHRPPPSGHFPLSSPYWGISSVLSCYISFAVSTISFHSYLIFLSAVYYDYYHHASQSN